MSSQGWRNLAKAWMPKGAALIQEDGFDSAGKCYYLPGHDTAPLAECLRRRTIGLFLKLDLITPQFAETHLCWKHLGFSIDNSVRLDGGDDKARQAFAQYTTRAQLSLQKLTNDRPGGKVLYHSLAPTNASAVRPYSIAIRCSSILFLIPSLL
jgi:hypothetical protein